MKGIYPAVEIQRGMGLSRCGKTQVLREGRHRARKRPEYRGTQMTWRGGSASKVHGKASQRPRIKGHMEFSASSFPTKHNCSFFETLPVGGLGGVPLLKLADCSEVSKP